jgi:hypothetical protein
VFAQQAIAVMYSRPIDALGQNHRGTHGIT